MASGNKFNCFVQDLGLKKHDLSADTIKAVFTNVAPVATNTVIANITDIATGGGYTPGGLSLSGVLWTSSSGTSTLFITDKVFTATSAVATFRYVVLYNATATNGPLIAWYDYASTLTMQTGETFTLDFDGSAGVLTIA